MKTKKLILLCWLFVGMPLTCVQAEVSADNELRLAAEETAALILLQMEGVLEAPFYDMGKVSFSEVIDRRLASLSMAGDFFAPVPQPVPQPPKIPKVPRLPHHLRQPAQPAVHTAAEAHKAHIDERARIDRQRRIHQPPPQAQQLPPRSTPYVKNKN
jgi:hypothetical protein